MKEQRRAPNCRPGPYAGVGLQRWNDDNIRPNLYNYYWPAVYDIGRSSHISTSWVTHSGEHVYSYITDFYTFNYPDFVVEIVERNEEIKYCKEIFKFALSPALHRPFCMLLATMATQGRDGRLSCHLEELHFVGASETGDGQLSMIPSIVRITLHTSPRLV